MAESDQIIPAGLPQPPVTVPDPGASQRSRTPEGDEKWAAAQQEAKRHGYEDHRSPEDFVREAREEERVDFRDPSLHFKNEAEAHEYREAKRAEDRKYEEQWNEQQKQAEAQRIDQDIAATRNQWSPEDAQRGANFTRWHADWQARKQAFETDSQAAGRALEQLAQTNPNEAARIKAQLAPKFAAAWQTLSAEGGQISAAAQAWNAAGARKNDLANQKSLLKDIPELADPQVAEAFVNNIHERTGLTKQHIRSFGANITDPMELEIAKSRANYEWKAFQKDRQAEHRAAAERVARDLTRGIPISAARGKPNEGYANSREAAEALARSGSFGDLLAWRKLKAFERRNKL
jgi:hypothetical protein